MTTSLDTAFNPSVDCRALIEPCLPHLGFFIPSIEEAEAITGETDAGGDAGLARAARSAVPRHQARVRGVCIPCRGRDAPLPGVQVPSRRRLGRGRRLHGRVALRHLGVGERRMVRFANATAAHCIQAIGCSAGVPAAQR